jgi:hypothetical protein
MVRLAGVCRVQLLLLMAMSVEVTMEKIAKLISTPLRGSFEDTFAQTSFHIGHIRASARNLHKFQYIPTYGGNTVQLMS